jgi:hypothetical protein
MEMSHGRWMGMPLSFIEAYGITSGFVDVPRSPWKRGGSASIHIDAPPIANNRVYFILLSHLVWNPPATQCQFTVLMLKHWYIGFVLQRTMRDRREDPACVYLGGGESVEVS